MGYRLFVALIAAAMLAGCAAFDHDNDPYTGFSPDEIPILGGQAGPYSGYFAGTMTVDTNACQAVSDAAGTAIDFTFDTVQSNTVINITFSDGSVAAGALDGDKATFLVKSGSTKHIYTLTFSDGKIDGSCDVIESDESGQFGAPCATYTIALAKGEKPAAE